jgi:hypothetical protein
MSECSSCGSHVNAGDRFCPSCGTAIAAAPVPEEPSAAPRSSRSGLRTALLLGGGCLTALVVGTVLLVTAVFHFSGDATEAAKKHVELIGAGDVERAYESASADLRQVTPLESYRRLVETRPVLRRIREVSFPERSVEAGVATVTARLEDESGRVFEVPMRLRKEGAEWRLLAIDWSGVPAEPGQDRTEERPTDRTPARPAQRAAAPSTRPTRPTRSGGPSVGTVVIGSGRNSDGRLIRPGQPVSGSAERLSADIELVDHPRGGRVLIWIERADTGGRTEPVEAAVEGEGSGNLTFNLSLGDEGIPPGEYRLVVLLGEDARFETPFRAN